MMLANGEQYTDELKAVWESAFMDDLDLSHWRDTWQC